MLPKSENWKRLRAQILLERDHLALSAGMTHSTLLLSESSDGHERARAHDGYEKARGGLRGLQFVCEGSIAVAEHLAFISLVAHEAFEAVVEGALDVADQLL